MEDINSTTIEGELGPDELFYSKAVKFPSRRASLDEYLGNRGQTNRGEDALEGCFEDRKINEAFHHKFSVGEASESDEESIDERKRTITIPSLVVLILSTFLLRLPIASDHFLRLFQIVTDHISLK